MMRAVRVVLVTFAVVLSASVLHAQKAAIGAWNFTTISPEGENKSTLVIREEGATMEGEADFGGLATGTFSATAQK